MYSIYSLLPFLNTGIIPTVISLLLYVGLSLGLYRLAKINGNDKPARAWIPFLRYRVLGELADDYCAANGKSTKYARLLPIVMIICEAVYLTTYALFMVALVLYFVAFFTGYILMILGAVSALIPLSLFGYVLVMVAVVILIAASSVISPLTQITVLVAMATFLWVLYPVYKKFDKENAALFLVLSLLFTFATSIILPCVAKKCTPAAEQAELPELISQE